MDALIVYGDGNFASITSQTNSPTPSSHAEIENEEVQARIDDSDESSLATTQYTPLPSAITELEIQHGSSTMASGEDTSHLRFHKDRLQSLNYAFICVFTAAAVASVVVACGFLWLNDAKYLFWAWVLFIVVSNPPPIVVTKIANLSSLWSSWF
jgi:hypothetical protein